MNRIRRALVATCLLLVLSAAGASPGAPAVTPQAVAAAGADCDAALPAGASVSTLPDPFARADGSRIATREQWACQRRTLQATAQAQVYGARGPEPDRVEGGIDGDTITVRVFHEGREAAFQARLRRPEGPGPHPVMIVLGGVAGVDDALLAAEGIARIDFDVTQVGAETGTSRERRGAFFELGGEPVRGTGTLMACAWGVSGLLDAIAADGQGLLRADAVAVTGCSRWGKGALAAGAFDPRIALTIPIESGSGGVPVWRADGAGGAQPPASCGASIGCFG